ncbi:hypothetical protein A2363_01480 [Candidatus Gottesmanbacteria bacterium RIFOXYB1_FULL_47_11]|uniref:Methyltransferase domain-containing protein n=1 Tax=Candidatus Gottesmanbacteria bacterium RIFOXYB1_FULL_47_11 TaxID=1798401 RepID=A0A1F6BDW4_9BACT|nr:MAG: hypothetical protein A2363_01480 [Candidatus Gottesmanbacteria bacterium RIFOXYB1_FULL_47_11]
MTKEGIRYWQSEAARDWPNAVWTGGKKHDLIYESQVIEGVGLWLREKNFIPNDGLLFDIGSGPSTLDLLGVDVADRAFAADISQDLLDKNPLVPDHKFLMDVGSNRFPQHLQSKVALAVSSRCARYLDVTEKAHVAGQVHAVLRNQGTYVIIDIYSSPYADVLGESTPFDIQAERFVLSRAGFRSMNSGSFWVPVHDSKFGGMEYIRHEYIVGIK